MRYVLVIFLCCMFPLYAMDDYIELSTTQAGQQMAQAIRLDLRVHDCFLYADLALQKKLLSEIEDFCSFVVEPDLTGMSDILSPIKFTMVDFPGDNVLRCAALKKYINDITKEQVVIMDKWFGNLATVQSKIISFFDQKDTMRTVAQEYFDGRLACGATTRFTIIDYAKLYLNNFVKKTIREHIKQKLILKRSQHA